MDGNADYHYHADFLFSYASEGDIGANEILFGRLISELAYV